MELSNEICASFLKGEEEGLTKHKASKAWGFIYFLLILYEYGQFRRRQCNPILLLLPGKSHEEPGRLPSMGSHRVGHDWSDLVVVYLEKH